mmetsp:Transcript_111406/g.270676  ORF Transcript_111406/g.270676 Transcript_111406/m.270676 type:complete len:290 (+) Transcript_111406:161-1030(+)
MQNSDAAETRVKGSRGTRAWNESCLRRCMSHSRRVRGYERGVEPHRLLVPVVDVSGHLVFHVPHYETPCTQHPDTGLVLHGLPATPLSSVTHGETMSNIGVDVDLHRWVPATPQDIVEHVQEVHCAALVVSTVCDKDGHRVCQVRQGHTVLYACGRGAYRALIERRDVELRVQQEQKVGSRAVVVHHVPSRILATCSEGCEGGHPAAVAGPEESNARGVQAQRRRHVPHEAHGALGVQDCGTPVPGPRRGHAVLQDEGRDAKKIEPLRHVCAFALPSQECSASARRDDH